MSDVLTVERSGKLAIVTLNRPERGNSFTPAMRDSLAAIWVALRDDAGVRAIIMTGAGDRHFCTGTDVGAVAEEGERRTDRGSVHHEVRFTWRSNDVWKPVICAVNGTVAGAGLHFVADADIVVAAEHAEFLDTHVNVGAVGALENIGLLRRLPLGAVLQMTLMGRDFRMTAHRAHQLGLVDELVGTGDALSKAMQIAEIVMKNSPSAMSRSQQAIWHSLETSSAAALEYGWAQVRGQWPHPDFLEGARAFTEKRAPLWDADRAGSTD